MKRLISEIIKKEAENAIAQLNIDGSFPGGHNGPYLDPETPVRNTAHWLFTFLYLFEITGEQKWEVTANKAADYLCSKEARPMNATFWCRKNPEKDSCNGLIGQAWVMEALIKASKTLKRQDCYNLAEEIFLLHPWDEKKKLWLRVNADGSYQGYDKTFNHQLWFAATAGFLHNTEQATQRSKEFFEHVAQNIYLYKNGVIFHNSPLIKWNFSLNPLKAKKFVNQFINTKKLKSRLWHKSAGYHGFNLYALSMYKQHLPNYPFWKSAKFKKMLSVINTERFINEQRENQYSYPYNPTGIELAFTIETFKPDEIKTSQWWLQQQINHTFENDKSIMTKNSKDIKTSRARIYEATRLKNDYVIDIENNNLA